MAKAIKDKSNTNTKFIHLENFIIDKVRIDRKNILNYIKGKSIPIFGDDYYYTYLYKDGYLVFLSAKSYAYISGKIPVVAVVFLNTGTYFIKDKKGDFYHLIEHTEEGISHKVIFEIPRNAIEINEEFFKQNEKSCTGFKLKWSLERKEYTYLIYVLFVFSLVVFTLTNMKANQLKEQVIEKMNTASTLTERQYRNTDLSGYLVSVADYVLGKGAIKRMEKTQEGLTFYISFKNEEFAQTFLKEKGGRYEQGQVIYTVSFASK